MWSSTKASWPPELVVTIVLCLCVGSKTLTRQNVPFEGSLSKPTVAADRESLGTSTAAVDKRIAEFVIAGADE